MNGTNWYTYCSGDPVNYIDVTGLKQVPLRLYFESRGGTVDYAPAPWGANIKVTINNQSQTFKYNAINQGGVNYAGVTIVNNVAYIEESVLSSSFGGLMSNNGYNFLAGCEVIWNASYMHYDSNGNLVSIDQHGNDVGYGYDKQHGVTGSLSATAAFTLMAKYVGGIEQAFKATFGNNFFSQNQFDALVTLRYNLKNLDVIPGLVNYLKQNAGNYNQATMRSMIQAYYQSLNDPTNYQGWMNRVDKILDLFFNGNYGDMPIDTMTGQVNPT